MFARRDSWRSGRRQSMGLRLEELEARRLLNAGDLDPTVGIGPSLTPNELFVAQIYTDLLQRPVDPAGLAFYSGLLDSGTSRTQVVQQIQRSQEYHTVVVRDLYRRVLGRLPNDLGNTAWTGFLNRAGTAEQLQAINCVCHHHEFRRVFRQNIEVMEGIGSILCCGQRDGVVPFASYTSLKRKPREPPTRVGVSVSPLLALQACVVRTIGRSFHAGGSRCRRLPASVAGSFQKEPLDDS
jgi:hypothetical protein